MSDNNSREFGVAQRYAMALYELASEEKSLEAVESELTTFQTLISSNSDFDQLIKSPVFTKDVQDLAFGAILKKSKCSKLTTKFISLVIENRRLSALPSIIQAFKAMAAKNRGEMKVEIVCAKELSNTQIKALGSSLKKSLGKEVSLDVKVDASLIGGLIVRAGSRQIDTSIKTKLNSLKIALKEVG